MSETRTPSQPSSPARAGTSAPARRPRLLVVGPLPPPLGGVQLTVEMLVNSSLGRDYEIRCVNTSKGVLRWAVEARTWRTVPYFFRDLFALIGALVSFRPEIAVVHASGTVSFLRDWLFMALARLSGAPVVCHYHGTLHVRFPSAETESGRRWGRLLMRVARRVIVVGPGYAKAFNAAWRREDVAWAPNLVDVALYRDVARETEFPWLAPGERGVLFMGRLSRPKGIYDLFGAIPAVLARHPEARFLLCGVAENDRNEPVLREEVRRRGVEPRVTFLGSREGREKVRVWVSAQVFVAPSWTEAFPLVVPEAMAAGVPMVVAAVGAIPDYVADGEDGVLVPPRDPGALAAGINRLLDDEPLRLRIAQRVRARAPLEFDIEVGAARVRAVLEDALERRPRRAAEGAAAAGAPSEGRAPTEGGARETAP